MSRWLLDTNILIWLLAEPERLDPATTALVRDRDEDVLFSAASIWEIAIKAAQGKIDFALKSHEIAREAARIGFTELPVHATAAARVADLPPRHRDPFDCLLIAQAIDSGARLLTADRQLPDYSDLVTLIRPLPPRA
jgi:PIN domain nuclease of toxin-antitoxin system